MKQNKTWRGFLSQEEDLLIKGSACVARGILVHFCSQQGFLAARSREKSLSHLRARIQVQEVREVEGLWGHKRPCSAQGTITAGVPSRSALPQTAGGELGEEEGGR